MINSVLPRELITTCSHFLDDLQRINITINYDFYIYTMNNYIYLSVIDTSRLYQIRNHNSIY